MSGLPGVFQRIEKLMRQSTNHREEELAQGQQLRLTREQMQRHHVELTEARRQLAQVQREKVQTFVSCTESPIKLLQAFFKFKKK